jgi:hypothetical protein
MRTVGTAILLAALAACAASCASSRPVAEPVIQRDATISPEREDGGQIERTERKHADPWKY